MALVSLPESGEEASTTCSKMVFRVYTTRRVSVAPVCPQGNHGWVSPDGPVGAISLSLVGMNSNPPEPFDSEEGKGFPSPGPAVCLERAAALAPEPPDQGPMGGCTSM
mmetsp:Transcript_67594/g.155062  ORF Transcript_67594/g.155062 Transcript_67594/m.155062 type:complete len:108 (+) Transcript_67594:1-324(+)